MSQIQQDSLELSLFIRVIDLRLCVALIWDLLHLWPPFFSAQPCGVTVPALQKEEPKPYPRLGFEPKPLSPGPTYLPLYFLKLKRLCFLTGDTLLAIQAPAGTQLEVPLPEMVGGAGQSRPAARERGLQVCLGARAHYELSGVSARVLIPILDFFSTLVKL